MTLFLSYLINGISLGSVYAIIALGYTMVYGIAKMLNFAHGDVIMIGAYISFCATQYLGLPAIVSVVMAMAVCTVLGIVIEGLAYRPLRQAPSLAVLITAIGVSYLLQNVALLIWGSTPKNFTSVVQRRLDLALRRHADHHQRDDFDGAGEHRHHDRADRLHQQDEDRKAMRAVSEDKGAAELMGHQRQRHDLDHLRDRLGAWRRSPACCCAPPIRRSSRRPAPCPASRRSPAAVFGGIGSIPGAMIGGILLA